MNVELLTNKEIEELLEKEPLGSEIIGEFVSMTGDFLITKEFLKELSPCTNGYRWFCETYPDGGKYQEILDRLCELDRFYDACWLLNKVGATDDVLEIDSINDKGKNICFAGTIIASKDLTLKNIMVGKSIEAGGYIKASEDYGVYAGLRMRISDMKESGYIKAHEKPKNIMCGYFVGGDFDESV